MILTRFRLLVFLQVNMVNRIPTYEFHKHKYGTELLVDVVTLDYIKPGIRRTPTHRENFYSLIFITSGEENVSINGHRRCVKKGEVICSIPGEVWEWTADTQLTGFVVIFEEQFIISFFNDLNFLRRFHYLQPDRKAPFIYPEKNTWERLIHLVESMKNEVDVGINQDHHILRAGLYGILILLERAEGLSDTQDCTTDRISNRYLNKFVKYVAEECFRHHDVEYYADTLCISPNYLNKIVRQHFNITAKLYIQLKLAEESKRLLAYTFLTVNEISEELHFNTTSYFIRFFKKHTGVTPCQFRERIIRAQ